MLARRPHAGKPRSLRAWRRPHHQTLCRQPSDAPPSCASSILPGGAVSRQQRPQRRPKRETLGKQTPSTAVRSSTDPLRDSSDDALAVSNAQVRVIASSPTESTAPTSVFGLSGPLDAQAARFSRMSLVKCLALLRPSGNLARLARSFPAALLHTGGWGSRQTRVASSKTHFWGAFMPPKAARDSQGSLLLVAPWSL